MSVRGSYSDQQRSDNITSEENRPTDDYEEINDHLAIRLGRIPCNVPEPDKEMHARTFYQKLSPTMVQRSYTPLVYVEATVEETGTTPSANDELM